MNQLDGASHGYGTYEQGGTFSTKTSVPAFYGATLIPVDDLISRSNRWRSRKEKVPRLATGQFESGIPFWLWLMQLMLCRRGRWLPYRELGGIDGLPSFRTLAIATSRIEPSVWMELESMADLFLKERGRGRDV